MTSLLTVAAYLSAAVFLAAFGRRYIARPCVRLARKIAVAARELAAASRRDSDLHALAGAVTQLAVALMGDRVDDRQRLDAIAELVVDLGADVARLVRDVAAIKERTPQ